MLIGTFDELVNAGRWAFWFPQGFYVGSDGDAHALPGDVTEPDEVGNRISPGLVMAFVSTMEQNAGGKVYFDPTLGHAVNRRRGVGGFLTAFESWVGREWRSAFGEVAPGVFGRTGWTVTWHLGEPYANGARYFYIVEATPLPLGLGVWPVTNQPVELPWWHGRKYKEYPPLGVGRPAAGE